MPAAVWITLLCIANDRGGGEDPEGRTPRGSTGHFFALGGWRRADYRYLHHYREKTDAWPYTVVGLYANIRFGIPNFFLRQEGLPGGETDRRRRNIQTRSSR